MFTLKTASISRRAPLLVLVVATVAWALIAAATAADAGDKVNSLPGWSGALPSSQYSGFLSVGGGKHLHYWLVESESKPSSDPVVFWFNGGPGCSSLDGYMYEHGPFHVTEPIVNTTGGVPQLYQNPHRWNQIANLVFLEAPAGVGFSYADTPAGLRHNDTSTAADNYAAVQAFFAKFPEYKSNEFFISGESYAGAYVPMLARVILENNARVSAGTAPAAVERVNIKGILVGNGVTGEGSIPSDVGAKLRAEFYFGHGLVSAKLYAEIQQACGDFKSPSAACEAKQGEMHDTIGNVNVYDIYSPCIMDMYSQEKNSGTGGSSDDGSSGSTRLTHNLRAPLDAGLAPMAGRLGGPDGCIDAGAASAWLNHPAVKKAIHVTAANKDWQICGGIQYSEDQGSLLPVYKSELIPQIRVLIFNGDVDACVPYPGNEWWTSSLDIPVVKGWRPWSVNKQVAGYVTSYKQDFTFLTVKGSGHMVPQYRPVQAFAMFERFINNKQFDCTDPDC